MTRFFNANNLHSLPDGGLDEKAPAVLVNDPARGKLLRVERAEFEAEWSAVHNWMLLALPHAVAKTPASSAP